MQSSRLPFASRAQRHPMVGLVAFFAVATLALVAGCPSEEGLGTLTVSLVARPASISLDPLYGGSPVLLSLDVENTGSASARLVSVDVENETGAALDVTAEALADIVPARGVLPVRLTLLASDGALGVASADVVVTVEGAEPLRVPLVAVLRTAPVCDDDNPCTEDSFDGENCRHVLLTDGSPCDDENACTTATLCFAGRCMGEAVRCDDETDCTSDTCDPTSGCVFEPMDTRCDDEDPCTDDVCTSGTGCENPPKDPGALCHFGGCDEVGLCLNGACVMHEVPNGFPCSDGDPCTLDDTCQEGVCAPGPLAAPGPEDPLVLVDGAVPTTLCVDPAQSCPTHFMEPSAVLATHRRLDHTIHVVWRTGYAWTDTGTPCDPDEAPTYFAGLREANAGACACFTDEDCPSGICDGADTGCGFCVDGDAPIDEAPAEPPPPPLAPPTCATAVFLTRSTDGGVVTTQLLSTGGAAAASLEDTASMLPNVAVATSRQGGQVYVALFDGVGGAIGEVLLDRAPNFASTWRPSFLAIDHSTTTITVAALPARRDLLTSFSGCDDLGLCIGVPLEVWRAPAVPFVESDGPLTPVVVTLEEWNDPRCATATAAGRPLVVEDFFIALTGEDEGATHVSLRMDPFACGDDPSNTVLSLPRLYRFTASTSEGIATSYAFPFEQSGPPWIMELASIDESAPSSTSPAGIVHVDVCDPALGANPDIDEDCICLDCEGCVCDCAPPDPTTACTQISIARLGLSDDDLPGVVTPGDVLLAGIATTDAEAHTVVVNGAAFTVARTGAVLSFLGRDDAQHLIYEPAPALPSDGRWLAGMRAGTSVVAGRALFGTFDTQPMPGLVEPVPLPEPDPLPTTIGLVAQGFACGADAETPPPFACATTSDCPGGLVCDITSCPCSGDLPCDAECTGACIAPPVVVEDGGVTDDAGTDDAGVSTYCLHDDECGESAHCVFPEACIVEPDCDLVEDGCPCVGLCSAFDGGATVDAGATVDGGADDGGSADDAGHGPDGGATDDASGDGGGPADAGA